MRSPAAGVLAGLLIASCVAPAAAKKREKTFKTPGRIHGYLVDPSGKGMGGVIVLCTRDGKKLSSYHSFGMRKGRFDIDDLEPGIYRLHVDTLASHVENLAPPEDVEVTVERGKILRPHLIARPNDRTYAEKAAGIDR